METLLLIPVDDSVVFPNMTVTLTVDVGDEERVLIVPRKDDEFASVGTVAEVAEHVRLPGGGHAVALSGLHRAIAGAAHSSPDGELRVEVTPHPDDEPVDGKTRNLEREYRAVVEELLELRGDDGRIAAFLRSISEPGTLADTSGYSPDISYEDKVDLLETLDVTERLEKALELQRAAPDRAAGAPADPRRRAVGRRQAAARVLPAQADGVDPQGAGRGRRLGGGGVPHQDRGSRHAGRRARAGREGAGPAGAHGRAVGRELDDPHLPGLADLRAVVGGVRRGPGPGQGARGAGRRPRRAGGRQGPDRGAHRRDEAAPRPRHRRRRPTASRARS